VTVLGVLLLVLGTTLVVTESHVPSLGMLGGPGVLAIVLGTVLAVAGLGGGVAIAAVAAVLIALASGGFLGLAMRKGTAARRRRVRTGAEGLIGRTGTVRSWGEPSGKVLVDGALWRARRAISDDDGDELREGDHIVVERLSGLTLAVRRAEDWELVL